MKAVDLDNVESLPGRRVRPNEAFNFKCHEGLGCFNLCCRNLNLFLYPYDVIRLKNRLGISSSEFIDKHVDVVLREGSHFPDVLLTMADNEQKTCPYLSEQGCLVYEDRPDSCRTFPVEQGVLFGEGGKGSEMVSFFRPPAFCEGQHEERELTLESWEQDQDAARHHRMTLLWSEVKALFGEDPWGPEGAGGQKAKMAFMAAYNVDAFRDFLFESSFLKRYKVKSDLLRKIKKDDVELMKFGFSWIRFFVWGIKSKKIRLR